MSKEKKIKSGLKLIESFFLIFKMLNLFSKGWIAWASRNNLRNVCGYRLNICNHISRSISKFLNAKNKFNSKSLTFKDNQTFNLFQSAKLYIYISNYSENDFKTVIAVPLKVRHCRKIFIWLVISNPYCGSKEM